jgi:hypothetical protein
MRSADALVGWPGGALAAIYAEPTYARTRTRQPARTDVVMRSADALVGWPGGALAAVYAESTYSRRARDSRRGQIAGCGAPTPSSAGPAAPSPPSTQSRRSLIRPSATFSRSTREKDLDPFQREKPGPLYFAFRNRVTSNDTAGFASTA